MAERVAGIVESSEPLSTGAEPGCCEDCGAVIVPGDTVYLTGEYHKHRITVRADDGRELTLLSSLPRVAHVACPVPEEASDD